MRYSTLLFYFTVIFFAACSNDKTVDKKINADTPLFKLVNPSESNVKFTNRITQDLEFNCLKYPYAYNGGGVSIGDINNDGLDDLYFTSNQESNKLYLNKGNLKFKDITKDSNTSDNDGWTTGTTMVDINNDGWLDIYVCKSANLNSPELRKNKLFVNQKDGTFKEESEKWGLADNGFSTQAYFFDFDKDGDLDMYLLNHRHDFSQGNFFENRHDRKLYSETSDHLYRNEGDHFTDITFKAGIKNKEYGLSAAIGDFNNDDWPDVYVANDLITPDMLYVNNKNGTFTNEIENRLKHTSYTSMGSDYADINNDLYPDLFVLDMSAEDHRRGKQNMPSMNTNGFWQMVNGGYHYSYMANMLNLNNGDGTYTDIANMAGVAKTDWSWGSLLADFDNDGYKDIVITNGLQHELGNQDYRKILDKVKAEKKDSITIEDILQTMPSEKLKNYLFKNNGNLSFENVSERWGFTQAFNSNGVSYGDLDNDGDLDLVVNNLNEISSIYENRSSNNFIKVKLKGGDKNTHGVGAKVKVYTENKTLLQELIPSRGFQSSVSLVLTFGIGADKSITRIEVEWSDGSILAQENIKPNKTIIFDKNDFKFDTKTPLQQNPSLVEVNPSSFRIDYTHKENNFNDFSQQVLLPQKQSTKGPCLVVGDVNGDLLQDVYIGGAKGQPGQLYIQSSNGTFSSTTSAAVFEKDKMHEDQTGLFFDADGDGDLDLFVGSGSYEIDIPSPLSSDRLYLNDGNGHFTKDNEFQYSQSNTTCVLAHDIDNDGSLDLIIGGGAKPGAYPLATDMAIMINKNGVFENNTKEYIQGISENLLINDLLLSDYDGDDDLDIMIMSEWRPITILENKDNIYHMSDPQKWAHLSGWWNTAIEIDINNDGAKDYLVGNLGDNNKFHPTLEKPLHIYSSNYDEDKKYDMFMSKKYRDQLVPIRGRECSSEQNPFVSEKLKTFKDFANSSIEDIYGEQELENSHHQMVTTFSSGILKNVGSGNFDFIPLPLEAQTGPLMDAVYTDINGDGHKDIIAIGAIYESEVETTRYDGNTGFIIKGTKEGGLDLDNIERLHLDGNAKSIQQLVIKNELHLLVGMNNDKLKIVKKK